MRCASRVAVWCMRTQRNTQTASRYFLADSPCISSARRRAHSATTASSSPDSFMLRA